MRLSLGLSPKLWRWLRDQLGNKDLIIAAKWDTCCGRADGIGMGLISVADLMWTASGDHALIMRKVGRSMFENSP